MKTFSKQITILSVVAIFAVLFGAQTVFAGAAFNNASNDCNTTNIANHTTQQGTNSVCWTNSVSAQAGQQINVAVYFHNTGNTPAYDTVVSLNDNGTSFRGSVYASNAGNAPQNTAYVNIPSNTHLELEGVYLQRTQSGSYSQLSNSETNAFFGNGLNIGTVGTGWNNQGSVKAVYRVISDAQNIQLYIQTISADNVTEHSARLAGNWRGTEVSTWFEYDTRLTDLLNGQGESTNTVNRGTVDISSLARESIYNLEAGTTYFFRMCGYDGLGNEACGDDSKFTTQGDNNPGPGSIDIVDVITQSATSVTDDAATLNAYITDGFSLDAWFVIDDQSDISCNQTSLREYASGLYDEGDDFSVRVDNLQDDRAYYFRACVINDNGVDADGGIKSFVTDRNGGNSDRNPTVSTSSATNIDEDDEDATLRGSYDMNDFSGRVFFAWVDRSNLQDELEAVDNENDINDIDNDVNIETVDSNANVGQSDSNVERRIDNLDINERHYFRLCVEYVDGIVCGSTRDFDFDDSNNDDLYVRTDNATSINDDRATLNGEYENADDADVFFVWGRDRDDIEDVEDEDEINDIEDGSQFRNVELEIVDRSEYGDDDDVSLRIDGLRADTEYFFRLCLEQDRDLECGNVKSFDTDHNGGSNGDTPEVRQCTAIPNATSATLRGEYNSDSSVTAYFRYGTTTAFGGSTVTQSYQSGDRFVTQFVAGLSPNTTYYCQFVVSNNDGQELGEIGTFRTGNLVLPPVVVPPSVPVTPTPSSGPGALVLLEIDDNQETVTRGQISNYEVTWENVSNRDLDEVGLYVTLPRATRFISSTDGTYNRRDHAIYVPVGELEVGEDDDMDITVRVIGARVGEPIVAEAVLAFENPEEGGSFLSAIELDANTYASAGLGLGASLFGFGLPTTLLGWVLLILVLLLLVLGVRYFYLHERDRRRARRYNRPAPYQPIDNN